RRASAAVASAAAAVVDRAARRAALGGLARGDALVGGTRRAAGARAAVQRAAAAVADVAAAVGRAVLVGRAPSLRQQIHGAADERVALAADRRVAVDLPVEHAAAVLVLAVVGLFLDRFDGVVGVESRLRARIEEVGFG